MAMTPQEKEQAILQKIAKGLESKADFSGLVKEALEENEITGGERIRILETIADTHPEHAAELKRLSRSENKAYICNLDEYTRRKKDTNRNKGYICNVFLQNNNKKHEVRPLTIPTGTLSYLGAMTHRGKTTALVSIAMDAIRQNAGLKAAGNPFSKVVFITTEETPEQIFDRMIKAILYTEQRENKAIFNAYTGELNGDIDELDERLNAYMQDYEPSLIQAAPKNLREGIFTSFETLQGYLSDELFAIIDHTQQRTFEELIATIKTLDNNSILLLDYIQHCKSPKDNGVNNRQVIIQGESQTLADIAGQKDLVIIAGGQFNRNGNQKEKEADKYKADFLDPTLFRESGDIEQDAHLIIGIGQQSIESDGNGGETPPRRFYEILKQRNHPQDTNKYLIADKTLYSLYSCKLSKTEKGGDILEYFTEWKPPKPPKKIVESQSVEKPKSFNEIANGAW